MPVKVKVIKPGDTLIPGNSIMVVAVARGELTLLHANRVWGPFAEVDVEGMLQSMYFHPLLGLTALEDRYEQIRLVSEQIGADLAKDMWEAGKP